MTMLFVEQPLASPRSAKNIFYKEEMKKKKMNFKIYKMQTKLIVKKKKKLLKSSSLVIILFPKVNINS